MTDIKPEPTNENSSSENGQKLQETSGDSAYKTPHIQQTFNEIALFNTLRHYCFVEDGNEPRAAKYWFTIKLIAPDKGASTVYITKHIDGEENNEDRYGNETKELTKQVRAWATCWGIRQFQQLGGVFCKRNDQTIRLEDNRNPRHMPRQSAKKQ
ncbi:hypothetical protein NFHSH190041_12170 [Shewanella sp. NFH-SH190041]|uniref:hypothetical protein n=1 Tax=Shewanella sp. NFH-SH190041 TaxID=2950245 RepID=UPI0021C35D49|nr:hypothetical protein [Shewanella sp. NFH-SH190041]BDM63765.1 hypothetical protein NFHSH190041_12170 [Shewanella sp. NFH-SH190041]